MVICEPGRHLPRIIVPCLRLSADEVPIGSFQTDYSRCFNTTDNPTLTGLRWKVVVMEAFQCSVRMDGLPTPVHSNRQRRDLAASVATTQE